MAGEEGRDLFETPRWCGWGPTSASLSIAFIFNSKGTKDFARQAIEAGILTYLINSEQAKPECHLAGFSSTGVERCFELAW